MQVKHYRDVRLFVNAGLRFPLCKASAELLDLDATRLQTVGHSAEVTCKRCRKLLGMQP